MGRVPGRLARVGIGRSGAGDVRMESRAAARVVAVVRYSSCQAVCSAARFIGPKQQAHECGYYKPSSAQQLRFARLRRHGAARNGRDRWAAGERRRRRLRQRMRRQGMRRQRMRRVGRGRATTWRRGRIAFHHPAVVGIVVVEPGTTGQCQGHQRRRHQRRRRQQSAISSHRFTCFLWVNLITALAQQVNRARENDGRTGSLSSAFHPPRVTSLVSLESLSRAACLASRDPDA